MHEADELLAFGGLQAGHEGMHGLSSVKDALPRNPGKGLARSDRAERRRLRGDRRRCRHPRVASTRQSLWAGWGDWRGMVFTMLLIALRADSMPGGG
jgi:hypothetical protein